MQISHYKLPVWMAAIAVTTAMTAGAQNAATSPTPAPTAAQQSAENEWLAKAAKIYFSSAEAGLTGFNCEVHPDWRALFMSAAKGKPVAADDPNLARLGKVKVTMHARMMGGSTIEWVADSDDDPNGVMENMHQTVQQMLEGFLQFWSPFMEVAVVPGKADGLEITHTAASHTIHAKQGTTELTEIFNSNLVLEQFDVILAGTSIKFAPAYEPTPQGLRVKSFSAEILPAGASPQQMQKMLVNVDYQTVSHQTIPGQLNMEIVGTGTFKFAFDGCSVETK
jgi:hypothetical protein